MKMEMLPNMQINKVKESFPLIATVSIAMLLGSLAAIEIIERVEAVLANALLPAALRNSNIVKYFCGLVVFVLSFFGTYLLVYLQPPKYMKRLADARLDKTAFGWWTLMAALAAAVILLLRRFVFELNDNGVIISDITLHRIPVIAVVPMIVVWGAFCVWLDRSGKDVPLAAAWVCYGVCVIFGFVAGLVMNIFHADIHHGVAYIESIYNVYHMVPYTRTTTGIYGHYGLLLAPLLHLFGDGNLAMMGMIAGLQALCVILSIYCVHNITDKNWMRILCVLASCVTVFTMRTKNYWQIQPHRVVFPLAVIAYVIHLAKTNSWNKKKILVGYGLCVLACLWNTESGLFCSAAFALAVIAHELQFSRWYAARMLGLYTMHICGILGSMCAAILIVNGYNFLCGYRSLVLADFFFPLFVSDYMSGVLKLDIQVDPGKGYRCPRRSAQKTDVFRL